MKTYFLLLLLTLVPALLWLNDSNVETSSSRPAAPDAAKTEPAHEEPAATQPPAAKKSAGRSDEGWRKSA